MELTVIEHKKSRLQAHLQGADNTIGNVIVGELSADKTVTASAFTQEHPLLPRFKMIIDTDGKAPKDALLEACKRLKKQTSELAKEFA